MSLDSKKKSNMAELQKKAELTLRTIEKSSRKKIPADERGMNLYKIELELQNRELLETQSKLIQSIEEYTELFECAPIGYFILDKAGKIINVNQTGSKQLGLSKIQLKGKHLSVFINTKNSQDLFYKHRNEVIETEKKQQFECELKNKNKSTFAALLETCVVKNENNKFKHLLITVDSICKQKEQKLILELALNEEKKLNEMKSQFIAIASHEFRTPLATILTSAELMEKYNKPQDQEKRKKHYHKISNSVNRLKEILIDFLSEDELERGKIENKPEIFNFVEFTKKIIEQTKSFNGIHNITYKHIGDKKDVFLDKKILKTCFSNLIINAYKYSPNGGAIEITTELKPGKIIFKIKDEGIGIPKTDNSNIFNQFFRAKNSLHIQGTGLGLNITKKLITIIGGKITYTSKENTGTTFKIIIPV